MIKFKMLIITFVLSITGLFAQVKTEEVDLKNEEILLPGTLTYTNEKSPLIIWVHGSGNIDRNGNQKPIVNANYIKQFRDEINKKGIAFYSYDKRTATPSNVKIMLAQGTKIQDFANDVKIAINHFKDDKRFSKIILIGHSQGSLIAMLSIENVDKYISLAGAGETIDKTLVRQVSNQSPIYGALTEKYLKELKENGTIKEVDPNLLSLFAPQNQPFLSSWIAVNPIEEIKKITIPTLIINGDKDLQVKSKDAENLHQAQPKSELVIIKNMNHLLKDIEKDEDNLKSYTSPNFSISKELIETVTNFINKKV